MGRDEFVERIIAEADKRIRGQTSLNERKANAQRKRVEVCEKAGVSVEEVEGGSRRGQIPAVRTHLAMESLEVYGLTVAEAAHHLGVSPSVISRIVERKRKTQLS